MQTRYADIVTFNPTLFWWIILERLTSRQKSSALTHPAGTDQF